MRAAGIIIGVLGVVGVGTSIGLGYVAKTKNDSANAVCNGSACATQDGVDLAKTAGNYADRLPPPRPRGRSRPRRRRDRALRAGAEGGAGFADRRRLPHPASGQERRRSRAVRSLLNMRLVVRGSRVARIGIAVFILVGSIAGCATVLGIDADRHLVGGGEGGAPTTDTGPGEDAVALPGVPSNWQCLNAPVPQKPIGKRAASNLFFNNSSGGRLGATGTSGSPVAGANRARAFRRSTSVASIPSAIRRRTTLGSHFSPCPARSTATTRCRSPTSPPPSFRERRSTRASTQSQVSQTSRHSLRVRRSRE